MVAKVLDQCWIWSKASTIAGLIGLNDESRAVP